MRRSPGEQNVQTSGRFHGSIMAFPSVTVEWWPTRNQRRFNQPKNSLKSSRFSLKMTLLLMEMMLKSRVFCVKLPNRPQPNPVTRTSGLGSPGQKARQGEAQGSSQRSKRCQPPFLNNVVSLLPSATCTYSHFAHYFYRIRYSELDPRKRALPRTRISRPARKHRSLTILRFRFLKRRSLPVNRAGNRFHGANLP